MFTRNTLDSNTIVRTCNDAPVFKMQVMFFTLHNGPVTLFQIELHHKFPYQCSLYAVGKNGVIMALRLWPHVTKT